MLPNAGKMLVNFFLTQGVDLKSIPDVNDYIKFKILEYGYFELMNNDDIWE